MRWAQRLKRVFDIDVKTCTAFGGTMHIIACIEDPVVIKRSSRTSRTKHGQSRRRIPYRGLDWRKVENPVYISYNQSLHGCSRQGRERDRKRRRRTQGHEFTIL